MKQKLGVDVFTAAQKRIEYTFDNFEKIYISFSAGKDSTVMIHMVLDEAKKRKQKVGVLFIDLEAQYKLTIDHAQKTYDMYRDQIEPYWVALPISLRNAVSVYEPKWNCWEPTSKKIWVRDQPEISIKDTSYFPFYNENMEFEEFVPLFGEWYSEGKSCACFVGIRSDESLNRYRTLASKSKACFEKKQWTSKVTEHCYNIYPIYDWKTSDIWVYHAKNKDMPYNKLYDRFHQAGLTIAQMRICQPYGDDQRRGLWLFHLIEPETWTRIVARVSGANSGSLYVTESGNINGYRRITKPDQHTWGSFAKTLLESMPPKSREHYRAKIFIFQEWWSKKGYPDGIPDEIDYALEAKKLAPSWRRVCKSLLRNDYWCKGMSFTQHKTSAYKTYLKRVQKKQEEKENKTKEIEAKKTKEILESQRQIDMQDYLV